MDASIIESEALHLPVAARAKLAHKLLESLDVLTEEEVDLLWAAESEKRLAEIQSGSVQTVSAKKFAEEAEALFK